MKPISGKDILRQLKYDLIGKDSYRGVTLTYSWLANQFGHFALGFIPTIVFYRVLIKYAQTNASLKAALGVSLAWLLFELFNFLWPLLSKKKQYIFKPAWGNVAFDTFTDLCFFWLGAFSAGAICEHVSFFKIILFVLMILVICFGYYWYLTKMYLQTAQYPFQFRLSQWNGKINEEDKKTVGLFLANNDSGKHLFVFGAKNSGKTSISVAIATEKSIKHKTCIYTTAIKLFSTFFEHDIKLMEDTGSLWTWRTTSVLVIDDINPGDPIMENIVSPQLFLKFIDSCQPVNEANRKCIREKNTIWVLGNENTDNRLLPEWQLMLEGVGVNKQNIHAIHLIKNKS
jgi:hypothetical protein